MPLDPRLSFFAGQGVTPVDPLAFQKGQQVALQLQAAQRQGQVEQMQLAEAQRQEQERGTLARAFRGAVVTDPATGQATVDVPRAFTEAYRTTSDPLTVFKAQQSYEKTQAASAKDALAAQKDLLENRLKSLEFGGQIARAVEQQWDAGGDPQQAWNWGIEQMRAAGFPIQGVPPTPDRSFLARWQAAGLAQKDALTAQQKVVDQQLRERELAETQKRTDVMAQDVTDRRAERQQTRESTQTQRAGEREEGLRKEFTGLTKDYRTVADAYSRIQSAQETGPGDISLIFSYMKLLDPGSTVREGEFATAQNAGGVPERVIAQYNRLISGERLAPETRKQFLAQAQGLYDQATKDYDRTRGQYQELARRAGVDPANVTLEFGSTAAPKPGTSGTGGQAGGKRASRAEIQDKLKPGWTLDQAIEWYRSQGWEVTN
jgi:hypothetical protein